MNTDELPPTAEPLLEPISADEPCGTDLAYTTAYSDLATLMEGTPETQFQAGKDPDWRAVTALAEDCLKRSKDLQVAVYFTVALSQTAGIAGAARGMELIAGLVRIYWSNVFPLLDPEDPDPTQRINILSQLSVEQGSFGDPVRFIERLLGAPIFRVPGQVVTLGFLTQETTPGAGTGAAQLETITAAGDAAAIKSGVEGLRRVAAAAHAVDDYLIQTLGRDKTPSFDPLFRTIDKGLRAFDSLKGIAPAPGTETGSATMAPTTAPQGGSGAPGEIRSHEDVRRTLRKIREFYAAHEPASPVPLLLERAEKLIGKSFLDLLKNLTPNGRSEFETLLGPGDEQT